MCTVRASSIFAYNKDDSTVVEFKPASFGSTLEYHNHLAIVVDSDCQLIEVVC